MLRVAKVEENKPRATSKPKVLHVVEALGGGVMVALRDYISSTQADVDHVVLANVRQGHDTGDFADVPVVDLGSLKFGPLLIARVRRAARETNADLVHLHSSWAGVVGRLAGIPNAKVVYTPHCYAFERTDCSRFAVSSYRLVEKALARRARTVVAVSPREAALARGLATKTDVHYVPNIARIPLERSAERTPGSISVVGVGRVMTQKDPYWFADFARELRRLMPHATVRWLGGGEPDGEAALRAAGVSVSGWIDRETLIDELASSDAYVHSAAWEGAPLSVIEAMALGLPVVGRDIPALRSLGLGQLAADPRVAAAMLARIFLDGKSPVAVAESLKIASQHTQSAQRSALSSAYLSAAHCSPHRDAYTGADRPTAPEPRQSTDAPIDLAC